VSDLDAFASLLRLGFGGDAPQGAVRLADGSLGWLARRGGDCWPAVIGTAICVNDIRDVPDLRLDARLRAGESPEMIDRSARDAMEGFLASRGLAMVVHDELPLESERWVGVIPLGGKPVHVSHPVHAIRRGSVRSVATGSRAPEAHAHGDEGLGCQRRARWVHVRPRRSKKSTTTRPKFPRVR